MVHELAKIVDVTPEIALRTGELRKALKISITDCYAIAVAEYLNIKALFLKLEKEMLVKVDMVKNLPISFLIP
jgi:predicted nucleic acid-binding protein